MTAKKTAKKPAPKKTTAKKPAPKATKKADVCEETAPKAKKETKATVAVEKSGPKPAPAQARKEEFRVELLNNWMSLNDEMTAMSEAECFGLLQTEREGRCRPNVILRLHGRFNKLRTRRERTEFMQPISGK